MKIRIRMSLLASLAVGILLLDLLAAVQAGAVYGTRRRTARRTAVVVSSAKNAETTAAQQQTAADQQQAAAAPPPQAPAPRPSGALPLGSIVHALPPGCVETPVGGVAYQKCGADYYRAAFQGSELVYVTTQP